MIKNTNEKICTIEHELNLDLDTFCYFGELEERSLSQGHDKASNVTRESFNDHSESLSVL